MISAASRSCNSVSYSGGLACVLWNFIYRLWNIIIIHRNLRFLVIMEESSRLTNVEPNFKDSTTLLAVLPAHWRSLLSQLKIPKNATKKMCHRWLFAVIMCILSWHPVYSLPLDVRSPISSLSLEGFPSSSTQAPEVSSSSSFAPNILPAPPGQMPSIYPVPKVQSVNQFQTFPTYVSHRVAFSLHVPPDIPSADDFPTSGEDLDEHGRYKRRVHGPTLLAVCDLEQTWRKRTWAIDILGENITVLTNITTNGNIKVHQWFYETTCRTRGHCKGIDHTRYESQCMTKKSWVFAMVRNARGEEGWNWISIDTACNCGFQRRNGLLHDLFERGTDSDDADLT